ncbi:MAG: alpha/beta hydrolase [Candidatus Nanopelagicales bacterium]
MFARPARLVAVGCAAVIVLLGCTPDTESAPPTTARSGSASLPDVPADLVEFYDQPVRWSGCDGDFDCTRVRVPVDYADPSGDSLELEVVRLRARGEPQGSLLLNPGGPGGSGVDYARAARVVLTPAVTAAYDVIGFDPRGVTSSEPVDCIDDAELDALFTADGTPDTPAEVADIAATSTLLGQGCKTRSPQIAPYMDTVSAARDMDILRAVLGQEKLDFLGKSYGTYLGAQYAELFPGRVGRMVLDGVLPSSLNSDEITFGQAKAFDVALRRFVADCAGQDDCPLPTGSVDEGIARIQAFLDDLDANPLPGIGERVLTQALGTYAILSYLYFPPDDWTDLRFGLEAAFQGDGSVLMEMMDRRTQRQNDGTFADNGNEAFYAVSCLDRPAVGGVEHAQELAAQWAKDAPVFGAYLAWGNLPCWEWPMGPGTAQAADDPPVFRAEGSADILVVSTTYDMATPHEWGVQVADELDDATLLTFDGDGHTAYTSGSRCIDDAVDAYLLSGAMPGAGTVCLPGA